MNEENRYNYKAHAMDEYRKFFKEKCNKILSYKEEQFYLSIVVIGSQVIAYCYGHKLMFLGLTLVVILKVCWNFVQLNLLFKKIRKEQEKISDIMNNKDIEKEN